MFQIPALLRRGCTFVVSPLKTLMSDQVSGLLRKKIPATFVNSALSSEEKEIRYSMVGANAVKFLYLAPERFFVRSQDERKALTESRPEYLVVAAGRRPPLRIGGGGAAVLALSVTFKLADAPFHGKW